MMRKLLLFFGFLALVTSARGADGTLSVSNVRNAVPGYTGSLDVVLSGSDNIYEAFQFSIVLPEGLTFVSATRGELVPAAKNLDATDFGSNTTQILCYDSNNTPFTAANGVVCTIQFAVSSSAAVGELTGGQLHTINAYCAGSHDLANADFSITTSGVLTLDEDATEAPMAGSNLNVKINRTLYADRWHTIVLPFAVSASQVTAAFGDGTQIGYFTGYTFADPNVSVNFEARTEMAAHTPYIIKVPATLNGFTVEGVDITTLGEDEVPQVAYGQQIKVGKNYIYQGSDMIGTYVAETVIPDYGLFLLNNQFMFSTGSSKLKAFRAYFNLYDADYDSSAREFIINFDDTVTGISNVNASTQDAGGDVFNLSGQRVTEPAKGLYIRGGQKLIIK